MWSTIVHAQSPHSRLPILPFASSVSPGNPSHASINNERARRNAQKRRRPTYEGGSRTKTNRGRVPDPQRVDVQLEPRHRTRPTANIQSHVSHFKQNHCHQTKTDSATQWSSFARRDSQPRNRPPQTSSSSASRGYYNDGPSQSVTRATMGQWP